MDQEPNELKHLFLLRDHKVYIAVGKLQSDTLPGVKREFFKLKLFEAVDVLPQHPNPCSYSSQDDALDVFNVATGRRMDEFEFLLLSLLASEDLALFHVGGNLIVYLFIFPRFHVCNLQVLGVFGQVDEGLEGAKVLHNLL